MMNATNSATNRTKEKVNYSIFSTVFMNEDSFEQAIIESMVDKLGWKHLYGPDVERTSEEYRDVYLADVFESSLQRINSSLPVQAIEEAIAKIQSIEATTLEERNEVFHDFLTNGVEVRFFDGEHERNEIIKLIDFDDVDNNDFWIFKL